MTDKPKGKAKPKRRGKATRPSDLARVVVEFHRLSEKIDEVVLGMSARVAEINAKVDALLIAAHAVPYERDEEDDDAPIGNGAIRRTHLS
jgi:hypothetical protein